MSKNKVKTTKKSKENSASLSSGILGEINKASIEPKGLLRVKALKYAPLAAGLAFSILSGFALYGTVQSIIFYSNYNEPGELLISLIAFSILIFSIGLAAWAVKRSDYGYKYRIAFVGMLLAACSIGFGVVLFATPVQKIGDHVGINRRLRPEERRFDNAEFGNIVEIVESGIVIEGGTQPEEQFITITESTRFIPNGFNLDKLERGQGVSFVLDSEGNALWIILPRPPRR